jgi:hypothetical protein
MKCLKVDQKRSVRSSKGCRKGQALTEFVLGLMIMISFFFFFIKIAATFVIGNYIHYATFMSARTYMASAKSKDIQKENAETVLRKMVLNRWKTIIKADSGTSGSVPGGYVGDGDIYLDDPVNFWNQGASYSFTAKFSMYPWNKNGSSVDLKLVSESWMPREQSDVEVCGDSKGRIEQIVSGSTPNAKVVWDGC